jgi:hypothetical protein
MCTKSKLSRSFIGSVMLFALILVISQEIYSQSILSGFGVEVGGGHNQLFWQGNYFSYIPIDADRTNLSFTPTIRVNYQWYIMQNVSLIPFTGYNQFGGKDKQPNGYQDQYWFDALECGALGMYSFNNYSVGVGIKANYHLKVTGRWLGTFAQGVSANDVWDEGDISNWFTKWSSDAGVRVSYKYAHFSISLESWFGITELQAGLISAATIRENQFRILIGYTL